MHVSTSGSASVSTKKGSCGKVGQTSCPNFTHNHLIQVCATQGAIALSNNNPTLLRSLLRRHASGDWGDLCGNDKQANDDAILNGYRILSSYQLKGENIWIITEHAHTVTTILLPIHYKDNLGYPF